jgi:hypothetical protein
MKYFKYSKSIKADLKAFLTHNKKKKKGGMCSAHKFIFGNPNHRINKDFDNKETELYPRAD